MTTGITRKTVIIRMTRVNGMTGIAEMILTTGMPRRTCLTGVTQMTGMTRMIRMT